MHTLASGHQDGQELEQVYFVERLEDLVLFSMRKRWLRGSLTVPARLLGYKEDEIRLSTGGKMKINWNKEKLQHSTIKKFKKKKKVISEKWLIISSYPEKSQNTFPPMFSRPAWTKP